jgi:SNF2 family DNA or RNA helicase
MRGVVIVPGHLLQQWIDWIINNSDLKLLIIQGDQEPRRALYKGATSYDVIIATYGTLTVDFDLLCKLPCQYVIFDETPYITNRTTKSWMYAKWLCRNKKHVHLATATPITSKDPTELYSLLEVMGLGPELFGSLEEFQARFDNFKMVPTRTHGGGIIMKKIAIGPTTDQLNRLSNILQPYFIRRLRADVGRELPPVTPLLYEITLTKKQLEIYDSIRNKILQLSETEFKRVGGFRENYSYLARAVDSPYLLDDKLPKDSPKLEKLISLLTNDLYCKKVVVFCNWLKMHEMIKDELSKNKIKCTQIIGEGMSNKEKDYAKRLFISEEDVRVMIVTRAAETGFDGMQKVCSDLIFFDILFNPARMHQLVGRLNRDGQTNPVFLHYLLTRDTVEFKTFKLLNDKQSVPDRFFNEENTEIFDEDILKSKKFLTEV